jgi:hypothetical protein
MLLLARPNGQVRADLDAGVHRLFDFGGADEEFYNMELGAVRPGDRSSSSLRARPATRT